MKHRSQLAVAALAAAPMMLTATVADAVTKPMASLSQCDGSRTVATAGGWEVTTPGVWESADVRCNLKAGDLPHRNPQLPFGDPAQSIKTLQRNLNYCYGSKLVIDGRYGSSTAAAVKSVQLKHKLTADGIYGPATRSAMNWRLYSPAENVWSTTCSSPI